jgi:tape measure domain-containing protein
MTERKLSVVLDLDTSRWSGKLTSASGEVKSFGGVIRSAGAEADRFAGQMGRVGSSMQTPMQRFRDLVVILGQARSAFLTLKDVSVGWLGAIFKQAGDLERLTVLMEGLSNATTKLGKQQDAANNLSALYKIARQSGFAVQELTDSFVKIKSGGIDPLNGSLHGLVDAVAAFGGNSETLHRASIAIQQMAGKGVVSMEELRQQLGEAVPSAIQLMADALGQSIPELVKQISKGTVAAKPALAAMFAEMERVYRGSGKRLADTLFGQMAQIRTNFAQLAADFTGMDTPGGGFFKTVVDKLKEMNAAMRSDEARAFLQSVGQGVSNVASALMSVIEWVVRFRGEILFVAQALATMWAANTVLSGFARLKGLVVDAIAAFRNFSLATIGISQSTLEQINYNAAVAAGRGELQLMSAAQAEYATAMANTAVAEEATAIQIARRASIAAQAAEDTLAGLRGQQVARMNLVATLEAEQLAALNVLQTGRTETGQFASRAEALAAYERATNRLTIARNMLSKADIAVAEAEAIAAEAALRSATAQEAATVATTTATAAIEIETAAIAADTVATGFWTTAMAAGAVAAEVLGAAVSVALGPVGIIAMLLYQAASACGVFESQADKATAAARRMAAGFKEAGDAAIVMARKAGIAQEIKQLDDPSNTANYSGSTSDDIAMQQLGVMSLSPAERAKKKAALNQDLADLNNAQVEGARADFRSRQRQWYESITSDNDNFLDRLSAQYARKKSLLKSDDKTGKENLRKWYDATSSNYRNKRIDDLAKITPTSGGGMEGDARRAALRQLRGDINGVGDSADDAAGKLGKGGKGADFNNAMATAAGNAAKLRDQLAGGKGNLAQFNAEVAAGSSKYAGWTDAQKDAYRGQMALKDALQQSKSEMGKVDPNKAFDKALATTAGKIAQLSDELIGGKGNLERFNAELAAGKYKGITQGRIDQMREYMKLLDNLQHQKDVKGVDDKLDDELSKATTKSKELWSSLNAGTYEADKRLAQVTSRFAGLTDGLKGDDLTRVQGKVDDIVKAMNAADAADITNGWEESTRQIMNGLLDEDAARQKNFEDEVDRQRKLISLTAAGTEERKRMEAAFNAWKKAEGAKVSRDNETETTKMMRQWAQLGHNIQQVMADSISTLVDGLAEGNLNIGKFVTDTIKALLKVILKAVIAYAILSALGMAPTAGAGGGTMSLGSFMTDQLGAAFGGKSNAVIPSGGSGGQTGSVSVDGFHTGGLIGGAATAWGAVDPAVFANARKYHTGGEIGGRPLMPGEVPIIAKEKELMLTEDQQDLLGRRLAGAGGAAPNVKIEFINNTGVPADATVGDANFNGKDWVIGVVTEAATKQGPLRDLFANMRKAGK